MVVPLLGGMVGGNALYGEGGSKAAPPPPDFRGISQQMGAESRANTAQQTRANRPNQTTPYASSTWQEGPDGQWSQAVGFNGPLAGLNASLQQQSADAMGKPFSLDGLPALTTGDAARQQAIDAAYRQASSRLDPQWQQREAQTRSRLLASGLQEGSAAYNKAFENLGRERNDAYNQANFSAIGQGTEAGNALFNQSLASRNQGLREALQQRGQAFSELQAMQQFLNMPGFSQDGRAETSPLLQGAGLADQAAMGRYNLTQEQTRELTQSIMDLLSQGGQLAASDERLKQNVQRYKQEAMPGVPWASWEWREGPAGRHYGVIAQDLKKVAPERVHERADGMLLVDYGFLGGR